MNEIEKIKTIREETGISLMECKKACQEAKGDIERAKEILRKKGQSLATKKAERKTGEGIIYSYVHQNNKVGVLLEIRCESDFVARSDDFQVLAKEIALQIAAMKPLFISDNDIPDEVLRKEKEIVQEQFQESSKPKEIIAQIVEGKIAGYLKENCLLFQPWIKDETKKIKELIDEKIVKTGENITINRFIRYEI